MNLPTEKLYILGRHKMFKCWKWSSSDPMLVGFIIFIALFWSLMEQKIFCLKTYYETKSFQIVQARFRRKFSFNKFPNRSQIFKLVKKFETHGTCEDRRVTGSSPSGPPITIRTPDNVTRVQESVGRSPSKSRSPTSGACTLGLFLTYYFWFEDKQLQIIQCYLFTFQ